MTESLTRVEVLQLPETAMKYLANNEYVMKERAEEVAKWPVI